MNPMACMNTAMTGGNDLSFRRRDRSSSRIIKVIGIWAFGVVVAGWGGCNREPTSPASPPPEVDVAKPIVREITEWDEYTGRLEAIDTVEVRPRVSGYLESVHFREGQIVKKGDLLFVIDPRPYGAALARAQGGLDRTRAEL